MDAFLIPELMDAIPLILMIQRVLRKLKQGSGMVVMIASAWAQTVLVFRSEECFRNRQLLYLLSLTEKWSNPAPEPSIASSDSLNAGWMVPTERRLSADVQYILLLSKRASTRLIYKAKWKKFSI